MSQLSDFYEAVINGNKNKILTILRMDHTVDLEDTMLHLAMKNENSRQADVIEILKIFLKRGVDINRKNREGKTVLHLAVERKMRDVIDLCIEWKADLNVTDSQRNPIPHFFIIEECKKLNEYSSPWGDDRPEEYYEGYFEKSGREVFSSSYESLYSELSDNSKQKNFELLKKECSSFVEWLMSRGFDFFHKRNRNDPTAFDVAVKLNMQHIMLTLLNHITDLSTIESDKKLLLDAYIHPYKNVNKPFHIILPLSVSDSNFDSNLYYNIIKIILEKSKLINDETLASALFTVIIDRQKPRVIQLFLQRISYIHENYSQKILTAMAQQLYDRKCYLLDTKYEMRIFRAVMRKIPDINKKDCNGESIAQMLLHICTDIEMLELLEDSGADFSARTIRGGNYLHIISQYGNQTEMIKLLMHYGCDVNATDNKSETPLKIAIDLKNDIVAIDLIKHGAKVNDIYKDGTSLLSIACEKGRINVVKKLIDYDADLNYKDKDEKTLLHLAKDSPEVAELLVIRGVDVNARDEFGKTPLHVATDAAIIRILFDAGARVDVRDKQGRTPLDDSLSRKESATIDDLLRCGANVRDSKILILNTNGLSNTRYLQKHLIKLTAADLLNKVPEVFGDSIEEYEEFFQECLEEAELLKNVFIDDRTTLYNLLKKNRRRRCAYIDNEKLKEIVEDAGIDEKFPNYSVLILNCYNEAKTRKVLLESVYDVLNDIMKISLPDLCIEQLFEYFTNSDLLCLIEAHENL